MTIAELERALSSWGRTEKRKAQEKAVLLYTTANLIGINIASSFSNSVEVPTLQEAFPSLFNEEYQKLKEQKEKKIQDLSIIRFKQFANSYNSKIGGVIIDWSFNNSDNSGNG